MDGFGLVNLQEYNEPNLEAPAHCRPWYRRLLVGLLIPYKLQITVIVFCLWALLCYFSLLAPFLCLGLRKRLVIPFERTETDFASSYCGAKVVSVENLKPCSFTCNYLFRLIPFSCRRNVPEYILSPGVNFDKNYCFEEGKGTFVIKLCEAVKVKGFTIRHLPPEDNHFCKSSLNKFQESFGTMIPDAPHKFALYGSSTFGEKSQWIYLGDFAFEDNGEMRQHFSIFKKNENVKFIRFVVKSNIGNFWETKIHKVYVQGERQNPNTVDCLN